VQGTRAVLVIWVAKVSKGHLGGKARRDWSALRVCLGLQELWVVKALRDSKVSLVLRASLEQLASLDPQVSPAHQVILAHQGLLEAEVEWELQDKMVVLDWLESLVLLVL